MWSWCGLKVEGFYKGAKLWKMLGHVAYPAACEQVWVGPWTTGPVFCCGFGTLFPATLILRQAGWLRPSRLKASQHCLPMRGQVFALPHNVPDVHFFLYASTVCGCFKSHLFLQEALLSASCLQVMAVLYAGTRWIFQKHCFGGVCFFKTSDGFLVGKTNSLVCDISATFPHQLESPDSKQVFLLPLSLQMSMASMSLNVEAGLKYFSGAR